MDDKGSVIGTFENRFSKVFFMFIFRRGEKSNVKPAYGWKNRERNCCNKRKGNSGFRRKGL